MTQSEFIKRYCEESGVTEAELHEEYGRFAVPCDCEEDGCEGWAMVTKETLMHQVEFSIRGVGEGYKK